MRTHGPALDDPERSHADKTEVKVFGSRAQQAKFSLASLRIGNVDVIVQEEAVRNLGVLFDTSLSMNAQVNNLTKTCNFHLANLRKVRKLLTQDATHTMARNLVLSRLDYCNSLLFGVSGELHRRMQLIQNSAARLVTGSAKHDHITPDLVHLHWLPVRQRIVFKIAVLVFKALHGESPMYISEMIASYAPERTLRSSTKSLVRESAPKCVTFGGRAFSYAAPKLWNKLPSDIRNASSLDLFKKQLKFHLFNEAYASHLQ